MNSSHSHGPGSRGHGPHGHGPQGHEPHGHQSQGHGAHGAHGPHEAQPHQPESHGHAAAPKAQRPHPHAAHATHKGGIRNWCRRLGLALFCKKNSKASALKITAIVCAIVASLYAILVSGLLPFDVARPIVKRALEAKLGEGTRVRIGNTRLGQNAAGQPVLVVNNIAIRNRQNVTIATAPRAEIVLDTGMLVGNFRAKRIDLIDAIMTLRIDERGRIGITEEQANSSPQPEGAVPPAGKDLTLPGKAAGAPAAIPFVYPEFAAWLDRLEKSGLDGIALSEVGLKQGTLVVESAKQQRRWIFANTNFLVARPAEGGVTMSLSSGNAGNAWSINATIGALQEGARAVDVLVRDVSPEDLMLAAGITSNQLSITSRISGLFRAQIAQDGRLIGGGLRASAGPGVISNSNDEDSRIQLDGVQLQAEYNPNKQAIFFGPILVRAGANQIGLQAILEAPKEPQQPWPISIFRGQAQLGIGDPRDPALVLDQIELKGSWDPAAARITLDHGTVGGPTSSLALSGAVTFGGTAPNLSLGIAANQLPVSAAKRLWPAPIAAGARSWIVDHVDHGLIRDFLLAVNMPLDKVGVPNVELPDEAVKITANIIGGEFRPLGDLPPVRHAQVNALITGRTVSVKIPKAVVETKGGRRFNVTDGSLEIANHAPPNPRGIIQYRFSGPADAIAETVNQDPLRSALGVTFDVPSTKGTVTASANFDLIFKRDPGKGEINYTFDANLANFASDNVVNGQRVEGMNARLLVTSAELSVKGDGKIAGAPSTFEYKRSRETNDATFRLATTLDDAARARAGFDLAPWLTGPVAVKSSGQINAKNESRTDVEADLGNAKIADLVPGWSKSPGRPTKATFKLSHRDRNFRIDDLHVTGSGTLLRGTLEIEPDGDVVSANFPSFQLSDGDKANLRAERASDGVLKATVRGDVLDVRGLMKRMTEGSVQTGPVQGKKYKPNDMDLEVKIGAASGNNGEVIRQLDLRVLRRNAEIRSFALLGKIGRDGTLVGDLRTREGGKSALYISTSDAGALFRFADYYAKIQGGDSWILVDAPRFDGSPQEGTIQVRGFAIKGEPGLDRLVGVQQDANRASIGLPFRRLQVTFNRTPGKFAIKEALIYGDSIGATCEGVLDYSGNSVHLRGSYIPAYGLNQAAGRALFFLGTPSNEGLFAYTFDIAGPASGPTLRVNPISGMMPGMFRKLFEFRAAPDAPAEPR